MDQLTFDGHNVHAIHRVEGTQACICRAVLQLSILDIGEHDCACSTPSLTASKLCPRQPDFCIVSLWSVTLKYHSDIQPQLLNVCVPKT